MKPKKFPVNRHYKPNMTKKFPVNRHYKNRPQRLQVRMSIRQDHIVLDSTEMDPQAYFSIHRDEIPGLVEHLEHLYQLTKSDTDP